MKKEINLKKKINLYKKKGWHEDLVNAYEKFLKTGALQMKKKIEDHYQGRKIIWESDSFRDHV